MRDISELIKTFNEKRFSYDGNEVHVQAVDEMMIHGKDTVRIQMMFVHPEGEVFKQNHYIERYLFISNINLVAYMLQEHLANFAKTIRDWEESNNIDEFEEEEI